MRVRDGDHACAHDRKAKERTDTSAARASSAWAAWLEPFARIIAPGRH